MASTENGTPIAGGYGLGYEALRSERLERTVRASNGWMYDEDNLDRDALWATRASLIREGKVGLLPALPGEKLTHEEEMCDAVCMTFGRSIRRASYYSGWEMPPTHRWRRLACCHSCWESRQPRISQLPHPYQKAKSGSRRDRVV